MKFYLSSFASKRLKSQDGILKPGCNSDGLRWWFWFQYWWWSNRSITRSH